MVILVRVCIQSWVPEGIDPVFCPGRGIGAIINAGKLGPCLVVSAYFHANTTAKVKANPANVRMLGLLGTFVKELQYPILVGADWNMQPDILYGTFFPSAFSLKICTPQLDIGSCIMHQGKHVSTVDYSLVSEDFFEVKA